MEDLTKEEINLIINVLGYKLSVPLLSQEAIIVGNIINKLKSRLVTAHTDTGIE